MPNEKLARMLSIVADDAILELVYEHWFDGQRPDEDASEYLLQEYYIRHCLEEIKTLTGEHQFKTFCLLRILGEETIIDEEFLYKIRKRECWIEEVITPKMEIEADKRAHNAVISLIKRIQDNSQPRVTSVAWRHLMRALVRDMEIKATDKRIGFLKDEATRIQMGEYMKKINKSFKEDWQLKNDIDIALDFWSGKIATIDDKTIDALVNHASFTN